MEGKKTSKYTDQLDNMETKDGEIILDDTENEEGIYSHLIKKSQNKHNLGVDLDQF